MISILGMVSEISISVGGYSQLWETIVIIKKLLEFIAGAVKSMISLLGKVENKKVIIILIET